MELQAFGFRGFRAFGPKGLGGSYGGSWVDGPLSIGGFGFPPADRLDVPNARERQRERERASEREGGGGGGGATARVFGISGFRDFESRVCGLQLLVLQCLNQRLPS